MGDMDAAIGKAGELETLGRALRDSYGLQTSELRALAHVGHMKMSAGDFAGAQRVYCLLVVMAPDEAGFQIGLADASLALEHFDLALQAGAAVIAALPTDPRGYFISGRACLGLGLAEEAREDLADAIRLSRLPDDAGLRQRAERILALSERV
jgi:tetratricopeptide (TPR) repeat protein